MATNEQLQTTPCADSTLRQEQHEGPHFFLGDSTFSVYEGMAKHLRQTGWVQVRSKARLVTCDLVLGDRFAIPYSLLRSERLAAASYYSGYRWINYFPASHQLTLKASMARILQASDANCGTWMPLSFVVGGDQERRQDDREAFLLWVEAHPEDMWIIKPSSGSKGKDIILLRTLSEIAEFIASLEFRSRKIFVAQRYVDRPLLYRGRKFDVRVWALLKSPYDVYAFSQGSCRTSSVAYDRDDTCNKLAHFTNHCLQEESPLFGSNEEGNELWFSELSGYLREVFKDEIFEKRILPQFVDIIVRTLLNMKEVLQVPLEEPYKCFQLFGYDLIIDDQLNVQLLEINGSPGVAAAYLQDVVRETLVLVNGDDAPRLWDLGVARFVKLWSDGDALPVGVTPNA